MSNAIGIKGSGAYWQRKKNTKGALLPEYLSAKYLEPFIKPELYLNLSNPIPYVNNSGTLTEGVPADLLSDICDVYIKANEKGALPDNQHIAKKRIKHRIRNKILYALSYLLLFPIFSKKSRTIIRIYINDNANIIQAIVGILLILLTVIMIVIMV